MTLEYPQQNQPTPKPRQPEDISEPQWTALPKCHQKVESQKGGLPSSISDETLETASERENRESSDDHIEQSPIFIRRQDIGDILRISYSHNNHNIADRTPPGHFIENMESFRDQDPSHVCREGNIKTERLQGWEYAEIEIDWKLMLEAFKYYKSGRIIKYSKSRYYK